MIEMSNERVLSDVRKGCFFVKNSTSVIPALKISLFCVKIYKRVGSENEKKK